MSIDEAYGLYDATGLAGLVVSNEVKVAELVEVALTRIEEHRLDKDDVVVRQGEGGRSLYIIREGTCVVDHTADGGDVLEVARLEAGDHFGEIALLGDGVRTATVRAAEPAVVLEVPHDLFQDVLLKNFEAVVQLDQGCADRLNLLQAH